MALNQTLRAEVERMLPSIVASAQPAEPEQILMMLIAHAPAYGVTAKNRGEWTLLFGSYLTALDGLPLLALEDAFLRWNRGEGHRDIGMGGFYPKAPQLYMLAETCKRELLMAAYRARKALEYVEQVTPRQTEEERERNAQAIRAMMAKPARHLPPQPPGVSLMDWARHCRENNLFEEGAPSSGFPSPKLSPHEVAERIRGAAGGDPGDVI